MGITVGELVAIPYLGTRLHAGAAGSERQITWAHSCEVQEPWRWLDEGDLLMTNGYNVPSCAADQVGYVSQLDDAGISGLTIGEQQSAPPLTDAMIAAADERGFPILFTAYEVPFTALSRAVANASAREEQRRLVQTVRLYERLRELTSPGSDPAELLRRLGEDVGARLTVLDPHRGVDLIAGRQRLDERVTQAVVAQLGGRAEILPALSRIEAGGTTALVVPVPSRRRAVLVALPRGATRPALAVLQHVATILALQVERQAGEREQRRRLGAEFLEHLMNGQIDVAAARHQAGMLGVDPDQQFVVAACGQRGGTHGGELHHALEERGVGHVLFARGTTLFVLAGADAESHRVLGDELRGEVKIGLSGVFKGISGVVDAGRQATWALEAATTSGAAVVRYGEDAPIFLPRTLGEADAIISQVLGPIAEYDAEKGTNFLDSLRTFLECNRSWQRAAEVLVVHKQTLVYRMRRIEELTGRRLDRTSDVAELWLALRALEIKRRTADSEQPLPAA